jgi:hypothetical protein
MHSPLTEIYLSAKPLSPLSTPKVRRYPSHLSHLPPTPRHGETLLHRRGTSKTYETLEDLLTAAGYKETRIFTPESERVEGKDQSKLGTRGNKLTPKPEAGVGSAVANFISAWIPGASISLGRAKGAELARGVVHEEDESFGDPPSPLAHRTRKRRVETTPSTTKVRDGARRTIPGDFIEEARNLPSSSATASLLAHKLGPSTPRASKSPPSPSADHTPRASRLRHVHSTPQLSQPFTKKEEVRQSWFGDIFNGVLGNNDTKGKSTSKEYRGRSGPTRAPTKPPKAPAKTLSLVQPAPLQRAVTSPNPSTHSHAFFPRSQSPNPLTPLLRTDEVVCRSRPSSRSASRSRDGRQSKRDGSPVLSPTLSEDATQSLMWALEETRQQQRHQQLHHDLSEDESSDGDADVNPDLECIVSSYKRAYPFSSAHASSSLLSVPDMSNENIARRQRSIRSLRALLVPRPHPNAQSDNPIFVVASPTSAEQGLPGRALWLDGPEWDGSSSGNGRRRRGLIPRFGGEHIVTGHFRTTGEDD